MSQPSLQKIKPDKKSREHWKKRLLKWVGRESPSKEDVESSRSFLSQLHFLEQEQTKNAFILKEADQNFLKRELEAYRSKLQSLLQEVLASIDWKKISDSSDEVFFLRSIKILKQHRKSLSHHLREQVALLLYRMRETLLFKEEMKQAQNIEKYYEILLASYETKKMMNQLYPLLHKLSQILDREVDEMIREAIKEIPPSNEELIDQLSRDILRECGLRIAKEIKDFVREQRLTLQRESECRVEQESRLQRVDIDFERKQLVESLRAFKELQKKLEYSTLKARILQMMASKELHEVSLTSR